MTDVCRVCKSSRISTGVEFSPYSNFDTTYYDCADCGCRFVSRDEFIYEQLHSKSSSYSAHVDLENHARRLFDAGDLEGLADYLCQTPKNRFVISHIREARDCRKVLEFGCSRGYLSSYSILLKKEFYGIDVSATAVNAARESFGEYFLLDEDTDKLPDQEWDLIYHVGTIGCVDDPVEFVTGQLSMLRSGGSLLFNAPNVEACRCLGLDWVLGTTPPDLVTLFPSRFWSDFFSDKADVKVTVLRDSQLQSYLRRRQARRRVRPVSRELFGSTGTATRRNNAMLRSAKWAIRKAAVMLPPVGPFARLPQEFGVYVKMTAN